MKTKNIKPVKYHDPWQRVIIDRVNGGYLITSQYFEDSINYHQEQEFIKESDENYSLDQCVEAKKICDTITNMLGLYGNDNSYTYRTVIWDHIKDKEYEDE